MICVSSGNFSVKTNGWVFNIWCDASDLQKYWDEALQSHGKLIVCKEKDCIEKLIIDCLELILTPPLEITERSIEVEGL